VTEDDRDELRKKTVAALTPIMTEYGIDLIGVVVPEQGTVEGQLITASRENPPGITLTMALIYTLSDVVTQLLARAKSRIQPTR